jgi:hypothetical protein
MLSYPQNGVASVIATQVVLYLVCGSNDMRAFSIELSILYFIKEMAFMFFASATMAEALPTCCWKIGMHGSYLMHLFANKSESPLLAPLLDYLLGLQRMSVFTLVCVKESLP